MKNYLNLTLFLSTLSLLIVMSLNSVYAQKNMTEVEEPKFIVVQHAQSGSISKVNATTNFLELNNVSDVILFSDRPDRIVKTESIQEFLDRWYSAGTNEENTFFLDPPNAALVVDDQQGQDVVVVELFEPAYDYDSNILVYNFKYLNNTISKLPNESGQITLVIDSTFINATPGDYNQMNLKQEMAILKLFNPEYDTDKMTLKYDITVDNTTSIELTNEFGQQTLVFDVKNTLTNKIKTIPIEY